MSANINWPTAGVVSAFLLSAAWAVNGVLDTINPPEITQVTNENQVSYPETDAAMAALLENPEMLQIFQAAAICDGTFRITPSIDESGVPRIAVSVTPNIYASSSSHSARAREADAFSNCAFNVLNPDSGIRME